MSTSLKRRTVLITRPREQSEELRRELEASGFQVLFFPTIQIAPPTSWDACDGALERPPAYFDGVVFASVNGVKGLLQRMAERGIDLAWLSKSVIYAVGAKTAGELQRAGLEVGFMPQEFNASALATLFAAENLRGKRFLVPRGNLGRDEILRGLGDAGAHVEAVEVYRTVVPEMTGIEGLVRRIFQGEIDVVAFASPSAVKNLASVLPGGDLAELGAHTTYAAIGPSTLQAIRTLGGTDVLAAKTSTAGGLADAIKQKFGDHE